MVKKLMLQVMTGGLFFSCVIGMAVFTIGAEPPQPPSLPVQTVPKPKPSPALKPIAAAELRNRLRPDDQIWGNARQRGDRAALLTAIDHSLRYLESGKAAERYQKLALPGITQDRVKRSLQRFRHLVLQARSATELQQKVAKEFVLYQSTGKDGRGTVSFTGYFEPVYAASRQPTPLFRYPLYQKPADLAEWEKPHPTRLELEGADGLQGGKGKLNGLELVWLRDRLEAFLTQVQGSARLQLTDGSLMTVGYAGHTDHPYVGIGRELVNDGKLKREELTLQGLTRYFKQRPTDLNTYLPRNHRFVFFKETGGKPATGSLGTPVIPERSIATDKSLFPPGALAVIQTRIPYPIAGGKPEQRNVTRYVLDQDTGGAILGPGRVDVFMGTGKQAGDRAGLITGTGNLYYLLLKN